MDVAREKVLNGLRWQGDELEGKIAELLNQFHDDTGLYVYEIQVSETWDEIRSESGSGVSGAKIRYGVDVILRI